MRFCLGCFACQKTGKCVIKDDMNEIVPKMEHADVLVFATPIYYYEMSGQMKTLLDRANPLFVSDYRFRDVYFLSSAAEDEDFVPQRAQSGLEGWIECFEKAHLTGSVFGGGVTDVGEIKGHHALAEAYEMGKAIR
jgi:Multimeric flavodoxin WrbA